MPALDEATKQLLIKRGRKDLVDADAIIYSGYGAITNTGLIVDRRNPAYKDVYLIPIQENLESGVPAPKPLP